MSLKFVERTHSYYLDSKRIPGVTTILNKGLPQPAIPYWSAKSVAEFVADHPDDVERLRRMGRGTMISALKGVPWEKRDEAAVKGTDIHTYAEQVIHGQAPEVPEHLHGYVDGYAQWLDAYDVDPIFTEQPIAHREYRYGGKPDAVVKFGRGPWKGRVALVDWKSSKGLYGSVGLQCAAYALAQFRAPTIDEEIPLPPIDCTGVVHIEDGASTFFELSTSPAEIAECFKVFRHVKYLADKIKWIDELVGQPWESPDVEIDVA